MNTNHAPIAIVIEPEQIDRYLRKPRTFQSVMRRLDEIEGDLIILQKQGDDVAVWGARQMLRSTLLQLIAIDAPSRQALKAKQRRLVALSHLLKPKCMTDSLIGTALLLDYEMLELSPYEEARMRAMLRIERVESD